MTVKHTLTKKWKQTNSTHIHGHPAHRLCGDWRTSSGCWGEKKERYFIHAFYFCTVQGSDSVVWLRSLAWSEWSPGGGHQDHPNRHMATGNTMHTHQRERERERERVRWSKENFEPSLTELIVFSAPLRLDFPAVIQLLTACSKKINKLLFILICASYL